MPLFNRTEFYCPLNISSAREIGFEHLYCFQCNTHIYKCPICSRHLYVLADHYCTSRSLDKALSKHASRDWNNGLRCVVVKNNCCARHTCRHKDIQEYRPNTRQ